MSFRIIIKRDDKRLVPVRKDDMWDEYVLPAKYVKFDAATIAESLWQWRDSSRYDGCSPVCLSEMVFTPLCDVCGKITRRLDLYEMNLHAREFVGYEVKTSKGDFRKDVKWMDYLPFCTQFYFVCPADMLAVEDVHEKVGLIYVVPQVCFYQGQNEAAVTFIFKKAKVSPRLQEFPFVTDIRDSFCMRTLWLMLQRMNHRYLKSREVILSLTNENQRLKSRLGHKAYQGD